MEYSEEITNRLIQAGTLGYPLSKILSIIEVEDEAQFIKDFDNADSNVYKAYKKGLDKSEFLLDTKLFELAKSGDLTAIDMFEKKKKNNKYLAEKELEKRKRNF